MQIRHRLGPVQIAGRVAMLASTGQAVLMRCQLNRLLHVDVNTGDPAHRCEHEEPDALIHVDVKELGNIPDGGGWRYAGRSQGDRESAATPGKGRRHHGPLMRYTFVHTVIDDHSRVAYAEIHDDERAEPRSAC